MTGISGSHEAFPQYTYEFIGEESLTSRPALPVGTFDTSGLVEEASRFEGSLETWSWTRLPLWIAEIEDTYRKIGEKPILALDLCSSVPIYSQRLRLLEFERDAERARELLSESFGTKMIAELGHSEPDLKPIATSVARQKTMRRQLEAALQESLYEVTATEAAGDNKSNATFQMRLLEKLTGQRHYYTHQDELRNTNSNERGHRIETIECDKTYLEQLMDLSIPLDSQDALAARQRIAERLKVGEKEQAPGDIELARQKRAVGEKMAWKFIYWQTNSLAEKIVGNPRYRPARFFSMDSADPKELALSALVNMPSTALSLDGFSHAVSSLSRPLEHIHGNIFEPLPFEDNSLALITCFDGWPFHFQTDPNLHSQDQDYGEITANVLHHLYQKLAYGGKIVIFPWSIKPESYEQVKRDAKVLTDITASFAGDVDEQFSLRGIHRKTLLKYMSASDRETDLRISPIFRANEDYFFALIISKSKASSLNALRGRREIGEVATRAQIPD